MAATGTIETIERFYQTTWLRIPEFCDTTRNIHRGTPHIKQDTLTVSLVAISIKNIIHFTRAWKFTYCAALI